MKKALIHDWYTVYGGAERCIESFTNIWEDFDHFTLVDSLNNQEREVVLKGKNTTTSFIQKLPFGKRKYRSYLPLFPLAIEQFDLRDYDLILSSSSSVAKGVLTRPDQLHISYVHSPVRYAWDLYFQYLKESKLDRGLKGLFARRVLHKIRNWDFITANRPDYYIANSEYISRRIKKIYNKEAIVIYPPVDVNSFSVSNDKRGEYYITCSRMVPYKKVDLIVSAFAKTEKKLIVIGEGPDYDKIKRSKTDNVQLLGFVDKKEMIALLKEAKAFIFAAEEDFGIAPVEAQACGVPVIAFGKGGVLETVNGIHIGEFDFEGKTGVFFDRQDIDSLLNALRFFEQNEDKFNKWVIRKNAENFSAERFEIEIKKTIEELYSNWKKTNKRIVT